MLTHEPECVGLYVAYNFSYGVEAEDLARSQAVMYTLQN